MPLIIFSFLFLLTPVSLVAGEDLPEVSQPSVCLVSVPQSVLNLPEIAIEKTKTTLVEAGESVLGTVKALPEKVDELALSLADKLEASKAQPVSAQEPDSGDSQVLGESTDSNQSLTATAYNAGVDVLGFLLRNWLWTISGLTALGFFFAFRS